MIELATATALCDACFAAGHERQVKEMAVVVTDAGGDVRAAMRSDGQSAFAVDIARAKAQTALGFRKSTLQLAEYFGKAAASTIAIAQATHQRFIPIGGGVVIADADGEILGAVAVAGGMPPVDDAIARAALSAAGLLALN